MDSHKPRTARSGSSELVLHDYLLSPKQIANNTLVLLHGRPHACCHECHTLEPIELPAAVGDIVACPRPLMVAPLEAADVDRSSILGKIVKFEVQKHSLYVAAQFAVRLRMTRRTLLGPTSEIPIVVMDAASWDLDIPQRTWLPHFVLVAADSGLHDRIIWELITHSTLSELVGPSPAMGFLYENLDALLSLRLDLRQGRLGRSPVEERLRRLLKGRYISARFCLENVGLLNAVLVNMRRPVRPP